MSQSESKLVKTLVKDTLSDLFEGKVNFEETMDKLSKIFIEEIKNNAELRKNIAGDA